MSPIITLYILTLIMGLGLFLFGLSLGNEKKDEAHSK